MPGSDENAALSYYAHGGEDPLPVVMNALRGAGRSVDQVDVDDLAGMDEFHALGRPATMALAELAGIASGARVVDVGAGLGGPARFLAARLGAHVTAVEPVERFRVACAELTRRAGLGERVDVVDGTATELPLADASMDFAWMQAVSISVPDKAAMAGELRRVLRPGGKLAFFDSTAGPTGEPYFPLPWADDEQASFLAPADELRATFVATGLEPIVWNEQEAALGEIGRQRFDPTVDPSQVGLGLIMPDFDVRMANIGRSIGEGRLRLLQAVLRAV
jgi:sarcosine/dimethylglycine N-methyltransferase